MITPGTLEHDEILKWLKMKHEGYMPSKHKAFEEIDLILERLHLPVPTDPEMQGIPVERAEEADRIFEELRAHGLLAKPKYCCVVQ